MTEELQEAQEQDFDFVSPSVISKPKQEEEPSEYIAHSVRHDKLTMQLVSEATRINEAFELAPQCHIRFEPCPGSIICNNWQAAINSLPVEKQAALDEVIHNVLDAFHDENYKAFMHYLDVMAILRRNAQDRENAEKNYKAEAAALKANYEAEAKRLESYDAGFRFCYFHNFKEFCNDKIMSKRKADGTWRQGDKSVKTLYGSFSLKAHSPKVVFNNKKVIFDDGGKEELQSYLRTLAESALANDKKAAKRLADLNVGYKKETLTVFNIDYDLEHLKALAEKEKLPGFIITPIDPNGVLTIEV